MNDVINWRDQVGSREDKHYKATLFQGEYLFVGINCLNPGQIQPAHEHSNADKVYIVMEGQGEFIVGEERRKAAAGDAVWTPAGVPHGVENTGAERLTLLVCIAPLPN